MLLRDQAVLNAARSRASERKNSKGRRSTESNVVLEPKDPAAQERLSNDSAINRLIVKINHPNPATKFRARAAARPAVVVGANVAAAAGRATSAWRARERQVMRPDELLDS